MERRWRGASNSPLEFKPRPAASPAAKDVFSPAEDSNRRRLGDGDGGRRRRRRVDDDLIRSSDRLSVARRGGVSSAELVPLLLLVATDPPTDRYEEDRPTAARSIPAYF